MKYPALTWLGRAALLAFAACLFAAFLRSDEWAVYENSTSPGSASYHSLNELPILVTNDVTIDRDEGVIRATGPDPFFVLRPRFLPPIRYAKLRITPTTKIQTEFEIYYQGERGGAFDETHKALGIPTISASEESINWRLPEPTSAVRIDLPEGANFVFDGLDLGQNIEVIGRPDKLTSNLRRTLFLLGITAGLACGLLKFKISPALSTAIISAFVAASFLICALVLPPMQGPDESHHWKFAMHYYRNAESSEPATFNLNEILGTENLKFHADRKLSPEKLLYANPSVSSPSTLPSLADYGYVHFTSFPFVLVPSLFFPRIENLRDALIFFYTCRLLPIVALGILFRFANARYSIPLTGLTFMSVPLVAQQFTVISPDTFQNFGTLLAIVIFLELNRQRRAWLYGTLWGVCLLIAYSKIILAGILLLPLVFLPWRSILRNRYSRACVLVIPPILIITGCYLVWRAMLRVEGVSATEMKDQIASFGTARGIATFSEAYLSALVPLFDVRAWSMGWLDTRMNPFHVQLIRLSILAALTVDLVSYRKELREIFATRRMLLGKIAMIIVFCLVFATVSDTLIFYIMGGSLSHRSAIIRLQVRHFFPPMLMALFLPMGLLSERFASGNGPAVRLPAQRGAVYIAVMIMFCGLLFALALQLMIDLLTRYWG